MSSPFLDPQARRALESAYDSSRPIWELPVEEARVAERRAHRWLNPTPPPVDRHDRIAVPGPGGSVPCEVFLPEPADGPLPLTIYLHGGGCVLLDPEDYRAICAFLARSSRSTVISPAYRLAPEHPFPAAWEDACAVYRWALSEAGSIGADPHRIALCGDSSGGYLAAAISLAAKADGLPQPRGQILAYPNLDQIGDWPSYREPDFEPTLREVRWLNELYAGKAGADPRASPLLAADHRGLASALVVAAGWDPLVDQGRAYAERLAAAGVPVTHVLYTGAPHGFLSMGAALDSARVALGQIAAALTRWLHDAAG